MGSITLCLKSLVQREVSWGMDSGKVQENLSLKVLFVCLCFGFPFFPPFFTYFFFFFFREGTALLAPIPCSYPSCEEHLSKRSVITSGCFALLIVPLFLCKCESPHLILVKNTIFTIFIWVSGRKCCSEKAGEHHKGKIFVTDLQTDRAGEGDADR